MSWLTALPPVAIGALLGAVAAWWLQHPRADLRIAAGSMTVEDYERLLRGNTRSSNFSHHPFAHPDAVRLTNYGNGTAYDIQFKGTHCRPRVWVGDAFEHPLEGQLVEVGPPMWNDTLGALGPGESVTVMVMTSSDAHESPSLIVSVPRLARRGLGRREREYVLPDSPRTEVGWPGEGGNLKND